MAKQNEALIQFGVQYAEIVTNIRKNFDFPFDRGRFFNHTWTRFDCDVNIEALLNNTEPYFGYKELVFAAFCAWLIDPANNDLRKAAVVIATANIL